MLDRDTIVLDHVTGGASTLHKCYSLERSACCHEHKYSVGSNEPLPLPLTYHVPHLIFNHCGPCNPTQQVLFAERTMTFQNHTEALYPAVYLLYDTR